MTRRNNWRRRTERGERRERGQKGGKGQRGGLNKGQENGGEKEAEGK